MTAVRRVAVVVTTAALIVGFTQSPLAAQSAGTTWSNVLYLGGAAGVRGKSLDWDNRLTISKETIAFSGKNKIRFEIDTSSVRRIDFTHHKHLNDDALNVGATLGGPIGALAGSAFRSTDHYLLIEYELPDGSSAAVLFRLHKDNQQQIIDAIRDATGIAGAR